MSQITMDVPVLVRQLKIEGKLNYQIRPLFFSYPTVTHRRYEKVEEAFRKEMKYYFQNFQLTRQTLPSYLWFRFNPGLKFNVKHIEFSLGKQYIRGDFGYAVFELTHDDANHSSLINPG